jgi:hypothetical protein
MTPRGPVPLRRLSSAVSFAEIESSMRDAQDGAVLLVRQLQGDGRKPARRAALRVRIRCSCHPRAIPHPHRRRRRREALHPRGNLAMTMMTHKDVQHLFEALP